MSRLLAFVAVALLAVPAYGQCGLFGGRSYGRSVMSGGCAPVTTYGGYYGGCGGYVVSGSPVYSPVYSYGYVGSSVSGCGCVVTSSPVQKTELQQSTPLPPDYYDPADPDDRPVTPYTEEPAKEEPTPAQEEEKPEPPAESFQATSYQSVSLEKPAVRKGDAILVLHVSPTADVWINGHKTQQTGAVRKYLSKDLLEGRKYKYNVVVNDNGRKGGATATLIAGQTYVMR